MNAAYFVALCLAGHVPTMAEESGGPQPAPLADQVKTLFRHQCAKCHGPLHPEGGLNLSTFRGLARGGDSGPALTPGSTEHSLLWARVSTDEMPPDRPLAVEDKALLSAWIESGAPSLPTGDPGPIVGADHWAFQHLSATEVPNVAESRIVRTAIDRYVQSRLEDRALTLGPDANARTLIRRVSFDLIGLPPTPAESAEFLADSSPDAYERMVEKYLESPHYGERWGKHWLDAAGYADSNGYFSADTDRPYAFRYRDYVIRSLNADKPFDRFVCEQLAGDEMATFRPGEPTTLETIDLLVATHFLRNGQDGTDIGIQEPDAFEIDRRAALEAVEQITASSLLGLTLHCARCHDHKFEPITQQEYYQFQAILFPAFNPQNWVNPQDRIVYAYLSGEEKVWEEKERQLTAEIASLEAEHKAWLGAHPEPAESLLHETFNDSWRTRWGNTAPGDDKPGGSITFNSMQASSATVTDGRLYVRSGPDEAWLSTTNSFDWSPDAPGDWIQATFSLADHHIDGPPAMRIGYSIAAHDFDGSSGRTGGNLLVDGNPEAATSVYTDYPGGTGAVRGSIGKQGYVPGRSYGVRVTKHGDGKFLLEHLVDGFPDGHALELTQADLPDGGFAFFYCSSRSYIVDDVRIERSLPDAGSRTEIVAIREERQQQRDTYEKRRKDLDSQHAPQPGQPIAWVTDKSSDPPLVPLLTRGLYHQRGPAVEPAALSILTDEGNEYRPEIRSDGPPTTGRRLGLAKWLIQPDGRPAALLARTHVNRIWQQYFGRGIVATTDNLGLGGAAPTHPELLDYLAARFIQSGWSQKAIHREIVTSTVYRQSSLPRGDGIAADPDGLLLWRRPIRRLPAEVIRDAMLAVAGQLDTSTYGPYVPTQQTLIGEVVTDQKHPGKNRRSIYLQQRRSQTLSMLKVFDAPSISTICTVRPSSTVPLQSLALLNSDFSIACSEAFAGRLLLESDGTPEMLIRLAWELTAGRPPTSAEQSVSFEFLVAQRSQYKGDDATRLALADFCQMLLASNAFLYLE